MYYSVCLFYKSESSDAETGLFEEQIILVSALDETEAEDKATSFAKLHETEFNTTETTKVVWKFYQIGNVFAIDDKLEDGAELFSRFLRPGEAESLLTPFDS